MVQATNTRENKQKYNSLYIAIIEERDRDIEKKGKQEKQHHRGRAKPQMNGKKKNTIHSLQKGTRERSVVRGRKSTRKGRKRKKP